MNAPNKHPLLTLLSWYTLGLVLLIFFICAFSSCRTQGGFNRTADNHKDWLSEKCEKEFPIDTTVRSNTDTTHADNKDYSKTIDSLKKVADSVRNIVKTDTIYSEKECNDLLQRQAKTIINLSNAIYALKSEYKPCEPSYITKTTTYTVESKSKLYKLEKELDRSKTWNKVLMGIALICVGIIFIRRR